MPLKSSPSIFHAIEISWPVASWVLAAHLYALLLPLALCAAVQYYWSFLGETTAYPFLFFAAALLMCIASAFEVAQNTIDRWYLTPETASANGIGFCDFLFYWFITAGQAVMAVAIGGDSTYILAIAVLVVCVLPFAYIFQVAHFAPMSIAGILVVITAFRAFGDPVIFLQFLLVGLTMYFFSALLRTANQLLHGFTTACASSGLWFLIWAIHNSANEAAHSWTFVLGVCLAALIVAGLAWKPINNLPASRRVVRRSAV